jgi:gamma-glutamyltranspeptidase / glutathione hydrolase
VGLAVDFGATTQTFHVGRGAAAVPLMLPGLVALHRARGSLPLARVVEPAAKLARGGVELSAGVWTFVKILEPILTLTPDARRVFAPKGTLVAAGERMINPDLGSLLERLGAGEAEPGVDALARAFGPAAGRITAEDLAQRRVERRVPVRVALGDVEVLLNPPPASGGQLVALGLRLLAEMPPHVWRTEISSALHLLGAMAAMDAARAAGDPSAFEQLDRWRRVLAETIAGDLDPAALDDGPGSTTHVSAVAGDVACAITTSNGEGCGHVVSGTGALANNFMGEADLHPRGFHIGTPGTRLSSMMCPTIVMRDGKPVLALGTGGANRIRTALLQVLVHHVLRGMPLERAVGAPRMHYEAGRLAVERVGPGGALADGVLEELRERVEDVVVFDAPNLYFGGVHAAAADGTGAGDPRRGGVVLTA